MPARFAFPAFVPRAPWWGADLQTLRNALRGPVAMAAPDAASERLLLPMSDGSGDRLATRLQLPARPRALPLAVLIHGLGGDERSPYLEVTSAHLLRHGLPVLRLNLRGAGPSRALCRQQYHAGRSQDLRDALLALPPRLLRHGVVAIGYSLGGNVLLKYLAEHGAEPPELLAAVSISAPIDLARAAERILEPRNRVYHRALLAGMKAEVRADPWLCEEERRTVEELRSIVDFDERIVAPRNGFQGAQDYYARTHARQFLAEIPVPTLLIQALDDPWIPAEAYTGYPWQRNPHLTPLLPARGGHVGFHGADSRVPWHDRCVLRFLEQRIGSRLAPGDDPMSRAA